MTSWTKTFIRFFVSNNQDDREHRLKLFILTVICLGENEVLNSQSNSEGEPADHEKNRGLFKPHKGYQILYLLFIEINYSE